MSLFDKAVAVMSPSGYGDAKLYGVLPESSPFFDFDVDRAAFSTRVNGTQYLQNMLPDYPLLSYAGGRTCPTLLTQPQRTRLTTYPISFDNAAWTKSGATVDDNGGAGYNAPMLEPNLGSELVTAWTDSDFTSFASTGVNITQMVASAASENCYSLATITSGKSYQITFNSTQAIGCDFLLGTDVTLAGGQNVLTVAAGANSLYFTADAAYTHCGFSSTAAFTDTQISSFTLAEILPTASTTPMTSAFKLVEDGATSTHYITKDPITVTSGATATYSVYAKAGERSWIALYTSQGTQGRYFDLANGVIGGIRNVAPDSESITPLVDGWYKCSITVTVPSTSASCYVFLADADGSSSYAGDGTSGAYIFFAQLEEGAYPTTPIWNGSEGATLTRLGDQVLNGGDATLFSGVNTSGVLYSKMAALADDGTVRVLSISDGTTDNRVGLYYSATTNQIVADIYVGGALQDALTYTASDVTDVSKIAVFWALNDYSLYVDGVERDTGSSGSIFPASTLTTVQLDDGAGSNNMYSNTDEYGVFTASVNLTTLTT